MNGKTTSVICTLFFLLFLFVFMSFYTQLKLIVVLCPFNLMRKPAN